MKSNSTLPQTNIAPKNCDFQFESPFPMSFSKGLFSGAMLVSRRVSLQPGMRTNHNEKKYVRLSVVFSSHVNGTDPIDFFDYIS